MMQTPSTMLSQENRSGLLANVHRFVFLYIFLVLCAYLAAFYVYVGSFRQQLSVATAKTYLTALTTLHQYYSNEIVHRARAAGAEFAHDYKNYPDRIPFPGTVAVDFGSLLENVTPQLSFSLYSHYPFPWRRDRILDDFEKDTLAFFKARQGMSFTRLDHHNGKPYVRYAVPVVMQETCVACHNRANFDFNQTWRVGDFRGARQVSVPVAGPANLPWRVYLIGALGAVVIGGTGMGLVWPVVNRLHQAKRVVTDQQALLSNMINASPSGIFMTDAHCNLILANPALCQDLGYASDELLGQPLSHLYHGGQDQMVADLEGHIEPTHAPRKVRDIDYQNRDGEIVPMQVVTAQLHDADGNLSGFLGIVRDITEERQHAARMNEIQRLEVMGRLAGGVGHYFNNLLAVILGYVDLLSQDPSHLDSSINALRQAGQRGSELTKGLLAYTRQFPQHRVLVDIRVILARLESMFGLTLPASIAVKINWAPQLWSVYVDERQLQDALLNLAINAQDAMPEGGTLTVVASNEQVALGQDRVCIRVSDTGVGMCEAVLAKAFEPFFTTKEVGQGTGLGLSMVYGFARQSGGHTEIQSSKGGGATVTLYLPRAHSTHLAI